MYKQVIVVRDDLNISVGKMIAQACHASLGAWEESDSKTRKKWEREGGKKVVLRAESAEVMLEMQKKVKRMKISNFLVRDAGLTEIPPGTITALGIGPDEDKKVDKITGSFPLL